jgi:hypothetical protein
VIWERRVDGSSVVRSELTAHSALHEAGGGAWRVSFMADRRLDVVGMTYAMAFAEMVASGAAADQYRWEYLDQLAQGWGLSDAVEAIGRIGVPPAGDVWERDAQAVDGADGREDQAVVTDDDGCEL